MASKPALSRLRKELKAITADPPPYIHVAVDEANILNWSYLLEGPSETPYEGGWYWGRLKFPKNYPFAPPSILMVTPNGRFETNTRLCLSMSDYHPETWQPAWSLATVLQGLLTFMCEEEPTAGSIHPPPPHEERRRLAKGSLTWNKANPDFLKAFPQVDEMVGSARARKPQQAPEGGAPLDDRPAVDGSSVIQAATAVGEEIRVELPFAAGDKVKIHGLKARSDLNGKEGVVGDKTEQQAAAPGRVCVRVAGEIVGIKPENLEPFPGTADAGLVFEKVDEDKPAQGGLKHHGAPRWAAQGP